MPLGSIPPVERGLVRGGGSSRSRTAARVSASTGPAITARPRNRVEPRTSTVRPIDRGLSSLIATSPSIHDVKVTRTPNATTWDFPYGEFQVVFGNSEVHIEVKIGRFVDALILELGNQEAIT